jgi:hypothetical protein
METLKEHAHEQLSVLKEAKGQRRFVPPSQSSKPSPSTKKSATTFTPVPKTNKRKRRASSPDVEKQEFIKRFKSIQQTDDIVDKVPEAVERITRGRKSAARESTPKKESTPKLESTPKMESTPKRIAHSKPSSTEKVKPEKKRAATGIKPLISARCLLEGPAWDRCLAWHNRLHTLLDQ